MSTAETSDDKQKAAEASSPAPAVKAAAEPPQPQSVYAQLPQGALWPGWANQSMIHNAWSYRPPPPLPPPPPLAIPADKTKDDVSGGTKNPATLKPYSHMMTNSSRTAASSRRLPLSRGSTPANKRKRQKTVLELQEALKIAEAKIPKPDSVRRRRFRSNFVSMMKQLVAYKERHGDCDVPARLSKESPYRNLARWMDDVRYQYRWVLANGEDSNVHLTASHMAQLVDVGFDFSVLKRTATPPTSWEERIEQCRAFLEKHGHLKIPTSHPILGTWCAAVRAHYKRLHVDGGSTKGPLTPSREEQLTDMGFVWLAGHRMPDSTWKNRKTWDERFQEYLAFYKEHGHGYVRQNERGLGSWGSHQRNLYKKYKAGQKVELNAARVKQLEEAGFVWDASVLCGGSKATRAIVMQSSNTNAL